MRNTLGQKGQMRPEGTNKTRRDKQGKKGQTRPAGINMRQEETIARLERTNESSRDKYKDRKEEQVQK